MGDWLWLPQRTALREEMIALPVGLVAAYLIAPTIAWLVAMIGSLLGLLAVEFLNTAIEKLSDHVSPEHHKGIGRIKDYGSAAVFSGMCLGQRFRGSNHIRRPRQACRTKCG